MAKKNWKIATEAQVKAARAHRDSSELRALQTEIEMFRNDYLEKTGIWLPRSQAEYDLESEIFAEREAYGYNYHLNGGYIVYNNSPLSKVA